MNLINILSLGFFFFLAFIIAFECWMVFRTASFRVFSDMFRQWQTEVRSRRIYRKIKVDYPVPPETWLERWLVP